MTLSLSEQLILGILMEHPRHGYDIEKLIIDREIRKWTDIGFSSIYYLLDKLESKKLVASSDKGKDKKQYTITAKGIAALKGEAKELIAKRRPANMHFMTGLAVSDFIESTQFKHLLQQRRSELARDLKALQSKQLAMQDAPLSARRLLSLSEVLLKTELKWVNKEIEGIKI